jgi:hypothetical protein
MVDAGNHRGRAALQGRVSVLLRKGLQAPCSGLGAPFAIFETWDSTVVFPLGVLADVWRDKTWRTRVSAPHGLPSLGPLLISFSRSLRYARSRSHKSERSPDAGLKARSSTSRPLFRCDSSKNFS